MILPTRRRPRDVGYAIIVTGDYISFLNNFIEYHLQALAFDRQA